MGDMILPGALIALWLITGLVLGIKLAEIENVQSDDHIERGFIVLMAIVTLPAAAVILIFLGTIWILGHIPDLPHRLSWRRPRADHERIAALEAEITALAAEQDR